MEPTLQFVSSWNQTLTYGLPAVFDIKTGRIYTDSFGRCVTCETSHPNKFCQAWKSQVFEKMSLYRISICSLCIQYICTLLLEARRRLFEFTREIFVRFPCIRTDIVDIWTQYVFWIVRHELLITVMKRRNNLLSSAHFPCNISLHK